MVKAKKTKNIHLTLVKKKGAQLKKDVIQKIRDFIDQFDSVYLFTYDKNVNTVLIQEMRETWKPNGRFTFAKNAVTAIALGKKPEDEYHNNLHLLSNDIKGVTCLLYTSASNTDVLDYVKKYEANGINLKLISYWNKSGHYVNQKKQDEKMDQN